MDVTITLTTEQIEEIAKKYIELQQKPQEEPKKEVLLKIKQVSEILGIKEQTIRKHIKSGYLQATRVGGSFRISRKQLEDYAKAT